MRNFLIILLSFFAINSAMGQETYISWVDSDGREFQISAPTGNFKYSMISGDKIEYEKYGEDKGKISKIGNVRIEYVQYGDDKGKISKIGNVRIQYEQYGEFKGRVVKVGGLSIEYEQYGSDKGRIIGTSGEVLN